MHTETPPGVRASRCSNAGIARCGHWNSGSAMDSAYLSHLPARALLAADWWPTDVEPSMAYFDPRFCVEVPERLLAKIFPNVMAQLVDSCGAYTQQAQQAHSTT